MFGGGESRNGVDFGGLQRFFPRHGRQNGGQTFGQHTFSRTRRTDQQDIVPARRGDFQRALDVGLALDLGKVRAVDTNGLHVRRRGNVELDAAAEVVQKLRHALRAVDLYTLGEGGLAGVALGHKEPLYARPLRRYLQHTVETLISRKIIADQVEPGAVLTVDVDNGELTVR